MRPCVPLVVTVDATTARIHWEMISLGPAAQPAILRRIFFSALDAALPGNCGLASLPCPNRPIISGRALRVLVIADPAGDAPLPGAPGEGESVAAIFEQFGHSAHVEVVPLLGPGEATRVAVLDQLINYRFDICTIAGTAFSTRRILLDQVGFSTENHGISSRRTNSAALTEFRGSSFPMLVNPALHLTVPRLEALCWLRASPKPSSRAACQISLAWPVDDAAALGFARRFYDGLLGLLALGAGGIGPRGHGRRASGSRDQIRAWRRPNVGGVPALRRPEFSYRCADQAGLKPKEGGKAAQENRRAQPTFVSLIPLPQSRRAW